MVQVFGLIDDNLVFETRPDQQSVRSLTLVNHSETETIAFKFKTSHKEIYCVRPAGGFIEPGHAFNVNILRECTKKHDDLERLMIMTTQCDPHLEGCSKRLRMIFSAGPNDSEYHRVHRIKVRTVFLKRGDRIPTSVLQYPCHTDYHPSSSSSSSIGHSQEEEEPRERNREGCDTDVWEMPTLPLYSPFSTTFSFDLTDCEDPSKSDLFPPNNSISRRASSAYEHPIQITISPPDYTESPDPSFAAQVQEKTRNATTVLKPCTGATQTDQLIEECTKRFHVSTNERKTIKRTSRVRLPRKKQGRRRDSQSCACCFMSMEE